MLLKIAASLHVMFPCGSSCVLQRSPVDWVAGMLAEGSLLSGVLPQQLVDLHYGYSRSIFAEGTVLYY